MKEIKAVPGERICLGYEGEHLARQVRFDLSEWLELYGEGTVELIYQRPRDETPYPVALELEGSEALWTVTAADVAQVGMFGRAELRYYAGETLVKAKSCCVAVEDALGEPGDVPGEPQQGWIDQVLAAGIMAETSAKVAAESAEQARKASVRQPIIRDGNWWIFDVGADLYVDSGIAATAAPEGIRPDWKQNDSSAPDYIKNRPFYDTPDGIVELLSETFADCSGETESCGINTDFSFVAGETYIVSVNGKTREVVAQYYEGEDGEPGELGLSLEEFSIAQFEGETSISIFSNNGPTVFSLSISQTAYDVKTIDSRYFPTETWIFTLDDGTVIEKKVVVAE